jgi:hypothetical protein
MDWITNTNAMVKAALEKHGIDVDARTMLAGRAVVEEFSGMEIEPFDQKGQTAADANA